MNFQKNILNAFESHKEREAFYIDGKYYTYDAFSKRVGAILNAINAQNIKPHSLIGILTFDSLDTYASIVATLFSSHGFVPLNINYPRERNAEIIDFANIQIILSSGENEFTQRIKDQTLINTITLSDHKFLPEEVSHQVKSILFTSGTTGKPKGVPYTIKNINTTLDSFFDLYKVSHIDRFLQMFELTFDMSMLSYLPALCKGACVYTVPSSGIRYLTAIKLMKDQNITFAAMVPSTLTMLKPYFKDIRLEHLRYSVLGGEPFNIDLAKGWSSCIPNAEIHNISGPTESCMACMGYVLDSNFSKNKTHNHILAFGFPWKNTHAVIINEKQELCEPKQTGELCFAGNNMMHGYFNHKELNKEVFFEIDGESYYKTGDLAFKDEAGCFYSCGRKDQQVKIQGFRVELLELENTVKNHLKFDEVAAISIKTSAGFHEIHLIVGSVEFDQLDLKNELKKILPSYMIPTSIVGVDKIPKTLHGKVDRQFLKTLIG